MLTALIITNLYAFAYTECFSSYIMSLRGHSDYVFMLKPQCVYYVEVA